jgi:hypothetical protein
MADKDETSSQSPSSGKPIKRTGVNNDGKKKPK